MKENESSQIVNEKISIFGEVLEFIETNQIEQLINKLSKSTILENLTEEDEIKYEQEQEQMNSGIKLSFQSSQIKNAKFPCFDGSFKADINKFLKNDHNRSLNKLYEYIIKEIQKMYHGYTNIESKLYTKINQYIQFSDSKNNTPMEILTKLKEISETLLDTIKFIELYLFKNYQILQKLFSKIDKKLSNIYGVESISIFFLLDIFDLPNNELSYMLMFKIIDEETCVLKYISENLDEQIKRAEPKCDNATQNNEVNTVDKEAYMLDNQSTSSPAAYRAIVGYKDKYLNQINESIINIDSYTFFRAKYYNKYIYTKGNYEVDTNAFLNNIIEDNDDINEEFLPLNSLMDEEVVINKFVDKSIIKKFMKFFYSQLPGNLKNDEKLIMIHSIQYNIICVFVLYWYRNYRDGFLNLVIFYIGRILSKIYFNSSFKKRKKIKSLLLISNIILVFSLLIEIILINKSFNKWIIFFSRFLIGFSYSKNIETKFILNYVPKLLVKKTIKKYFSISLLSLSLGFFLVSSFNYLFYFFAKKEEDEEEEDFDELKFLNLDVVTLGEIIICLFSFIILIINFLVFKAPNVFGPNILNKSTKKSLNKSHESEKVSNINQEKEKEREKKETTSIFSYGKAKMISFKEKNKAKLFEESLKLDIGQKNYEGTNQIFTILQKLIIKESTLSNSYTNQTTKGYILLYTLLYIASSIIIFYNPIIKSSDKNENTKIFESKNKLWIFGFPYLLSYLIFIFKIIKFSSDIFVWNIIILIFICFEIALSVIFLIFDKSFFSKTPLDFNNYYFYGFLALILFFNILIEISSLKSMIREIPIEKKISSINIDNFFDIYENLIRCATFGGFYLINYYLIAQKTIYIKFIISILYILACIIFIVYNFKRRQVSLIKIINKVTYES